MELSAQMHFRQGWKLSLLQDAASLGIDTIRDSIGWGAVEATKGQYNFGHKDASWIDKSIAAGIDVILIFDPHNKHYDNGQTIYSKQSLEAFADFVAATLQHYPEITKIELGNEYNGNHFVKGRIANAPASKRDDFYHDMVEAVDKALSEAGLDVTVIGASTHSIPVGYFNKLDNNGTLDMLDGISIHPYTTDPEQFGDQLALLRARVGDDLEIHVTEFADDFATAEEASAYLTKMVATMAANDVTTANWYAFAKQSFFPNMELWDQKKDAPSLAGVTFSLLEDLLEGDVEVTQLDIDSYTYFYTFGDNAAILWGERRSVELGEGVKAYDLAGKEITDFAALSADMPVILRSDGVLTQDSVTLGENYLLADSFHDFDLSNGSNALALEDSPWSYFAENGNGRVFEVETRGGDIAGGVPWTPFLGAAGLNPLQISATSVTPIDQSRDKRAWKEYSTVERFTADDDGVVTIRGHWDVANHSSNGVELEIRHNGEAIFTKAITNKAEGYVFDLELAGITLAAGDTLDFVISARHDPKGDVTSRRIQIFESDVPFAADDEGISYTPALPAYEASSSDNLYDRSDASKAVKIDASNQDDLILGGSGNDQIYGRGGVDSIYAGDGNDKIFASASDAVIDGGAGRDMLTVYGSDGIEIDLAAASIEVVKGSKGGDVLDGSDASSKLVLNGNNGSDLLSGGSNKDVLRGGNGHDTIEGGAGNDTLVGGKGRDVFVFDEGFDRDTIRDFGAGDLIDLSQIAGVDGIEDLDFNYARGDTFIAIGDDVIRLNNVRPAQLDADDFLF